MRIGFHYFPDTLHYSQSDMDTWLPELQSLEAAWLTLMAPTNRAISEFFLKELIAADIQPIVHFQLSFDTPPHLEDLTLLFETYAHWGVRYVALYDRPNTRMAWGSTAWGQYGLVERFLDMYLPLAEASLDAGLTPVFPPLEPGGDYWDTSFLRTALEAILRRGHTRLLDNLVLGAYAWADEHPLNWGAGGPERWPDSRPYVTPPESQDQRGFRIFDWYITLSRAVLGNSIPLLLLGMGHRLNRNPDSQQPLNEADIHTQTNLTIAHLLESDIPPDGQELIPSEVIGGCYWLLTADENSPYAQQAWYTSKGDVLPIVPTMHKWLQHQYQETLHKARAKKRPSNSTTQPIVHYLLLPANKLGVSPWHLDIIRPFVNKHQPTIGFSVDEAVHASHVTVIGGTKPIPKRTLKRLHAAGCQIDIVEGDGTEIASKLANL
ncbi:MAG: hypothetical protein AB1345_02355 [Chloroflexota bacterium]